MPDVDDRWPDLGLGSHGSVSIGAVSSGRLFNGRALPLEGDCHHVMAEHQRRATNFGTDELISTVEAAARAVCQEHPGALMTVGNISRKGGGRIPWSISHRAGRDVDIAFYLLGTEGEQVVLENMVALTAPDGLAQTAHGEVRFDVHRNWALLRFLLTQDAVDVHYVFAADHLLEMLFAEALKEGFTEADLARWRTFVRQPRGTLPHDDHFHIRIGCDEADLAEGCRDIVAGRERTPYGNQAFERRTQELIRLAADKQHPLQARLTALDRLAWMRGNGTTDLAYRLLDGSGAPELEERALAALEELEARPRTKPLLAFLSRTSDPHGATRALRLLRGVAARYARRLKPLLTRDAVLVGRQHYWTVEADLLAESIRLFGWLGDLAQGSAVVPFLLHSRPEVRRATLWSLRAMAADPVFPDTVIDSPPADVATQWRRFVRMHRNVEKNLLRNMVQKGYKVKRRFGPRDARQLLSAIRDEDYLSLNAQRVLARLTGRNVALGLKDKGHVRWLWKKMVRRAFR